MRDVLADHTLADLAGRLAHKAPAKFSEDVASWFEARAAGVAVAPAARIHLPAMCKRSLMSHLRIVGTAVLLAFSAQPAQQALAAEQAAVTRSCRRTCRTIPARK